jgi:hypothetical protein
MPIYRRRGDSDTWHWCTNCSEYPIGSDVYASFMNPTYGELCDECQAITDRGDCRRY